VTPATCEPVGVLQVFISGDSTINNVVLYEWSGPGTTNPNTYLASVWENLASGWYYINIEDAVCSINDSVFVDILDPPVAEFSANPTSGCTPLEVTFTNTSQNASSYSWNFGNGQTTNTNNTSPQYQTYTDNTTIRLIANQGNCADTAYLNVAVSICGCTDINATNYNSLATVDDGSCIFPIPTVVAPNVFSPNNDGANPLFYLSTTYSTSIELTILNRWGNVVYEAVGINPVWDGISQNGSDVPEGVYFYKYVIKGYQEFVLEGHGFVHLVR
jgi:gliding motility-associated-like protein